MHVLEPYSFIFFYPPQSIIFFTVNIVNFHQLWLNTVFCHLHADILETSLQTNSHIKNKGTFILLNITLLHFKISIKTQEIISKTKLNSILEFKKRY